jgi:hypothetical protein
MTQTPFHSIEKFEKFNYFTELSTDFSKFIKNKDFEQNQNSIFSEALSKTNLTADSAFLAYLMNEHHAYE